MADSDNIKAPPEGLNCGLDDHSEELSERSEADAQVRFYRAMADTEVDYDRLLDNLAKAVAEVIFDFCIVYLSDDEGQIRSPSAYHPHPGILQSLHDAFTDTSPGLVERVIAGRDSYFRPRWRPSLLQPYISDGETPSIPDIDIHSLMAVPMFTTDGACLGALLVGRHTTTLSYDEADLALTEWIASHAAMKLETARLYRDLRETNRQLDAAVQARDTFISIASHQLRTPLSTLKLQSDALRRTAANKPETLTAEQVLSKVDSIDRQVDYLDRLVDQLLDVTRILDGSVDIHWQRCDLEGVINEVTARFEHAAADAGSDLTVDCPDPLVGLWDRQRLDHILTNLVSNAIKYGEGSGIEIIGRRNHDEALLRVRDGGRGIPPQAQDTIFERFERAVDARNKEGLGLGLWIVREYVNSLDGTIDVESTPGEGSTFTVRLPIEPPSAK